VAGEKANAPLSSGTKRRWTALPFFPFPPQRNGAPGGATGLRVPWHDIPGRGSLFLGVHNSLKLLDVDGMIGHRHSSGGLQEATYLATR
jgi:hypothetical protein